MRVDLAGKTALVTGAAQGIGKAIALELAANGARVVATDRNGEGARDTAAECGDGPLSFALDVSDRQAILDVTGAAAEALGGCIDILVNNAGIGVPADERKTVEGFSAELWDRIIAVDLTGVFLMSQACVPYLRKSASGRIVNIGSVLGLVPMRLQSGYVAAKAAVTNLTRSMALELAPHGRWVNGVAPGSTETEAWTKWIRDGRSDAMDLHARLMSHIPLARPAKPSEIAKGVLFLVAPDTGYITGHILPIDGGWTAGFARDY